MADFLILGIDYAKCQICRECLKECPQKLFKIDPLKKVVFEDTDSRCIACGHCLAVCPCDAILYQAPERSLRSPIFEEPDKIINFETLLPLLRARRSIRRFKPNPVAREDLLNIIEAMRYAPTASNRQRLHFTIVYGKMIETFASRVAKLFKLLYWALKILRFIIPFGHQSKYGILSNSSFSSLKFFFRMKAAGEDPVFWHAPALLVVSSPPYFHQASLDAGIALAQGMLAAQSLGLGTCLIGFAQETLYLSRKLRRILQIPLKFRPLGVMAIGYPQVRFRAAPPRNKPSITEISCRA